jgi:N-acetylglucosamine-6-sulfatase
LRLLLALALLAALPAPAPAARPNVVVIETDDQTVEDLAAMPLTRALIADRGVTFERSYVSLSQCCPSRATLLTGRYAHNHTVLNTGPPWGGIARLDGSETLPVWLRRAGYATALVGKYLNGYGRGNRRMVPPGWTEWHGLLGRTTYRYYDYVVNDDGVLHRHGTAATDYQTDVLTARAVDVLQRRLPHPRPLFLWLAYVAPHVGQPHDVLDPPGLKSAVAAPRHRGMFTGLLPPPSPSFNEADVSDKPPAVRRLPLLRPPDIAALDDTVFQRRQSLLAVDEGVARVVGALRDAGELDRTLLIFTSDNGFMTGEHRDPHGKVLPYEPSIRVPLLVRGPGVPRGVSRRLVWNGDLAPTILAAARARAPWPLDGRSLWARGRRPILLEGPALRRSNGLPSFTGVRTDRWVYVEHLTGPRELYDLRRDPDELRNLAGRPAAAGTQRELARELARLRRCDGVSCRPARRTRARTGSGRSA